MSDVRIAPPFFGEPMAPANPSIEARRLLALRRSASADRMGPPGPDDETLAAMLEIAARVPDHRKIFPFRFLVFSGARRMAAGEVLAARFRALEPAAEAERVALERGRFARAPVVVAVVARIDRNHKTPEWEQILSNGAVCQTLLLAASAFGFAANWITEWYAYDQPVKRAFGLDDSEAVSGFVYIGTATAPPLERQRPVMKDIVSKY